MLASLGCGTPFRRGDANGDGNLDISDLIFSLNYLFRGGEAPGCLASTDANGDDAADISDVIFGLNFLFRGGPEVPNPFPDCGLPPVQGALTCDVYDCS